MKLHCFAAIALVFVCSGQLVYSQGSQDSVSNEATWHVKRNKGVFGLVEPDFGPYHTLDVAKLDSPVHRRKTKDPEGATVSVSGSEGIDITKQQTISKQKYYRLQLGSPTDTTEAFFEIASTSNERKQTLIGRLLSKNEEGSSAVLSFSRDVAGRIVTGSDSTAWQFFIADFTSGGRQTEMAFAPMASLASVHLTNDHDSLYTKSNAGRFTDVELYDRTGEVCATLEFTGNRASIWIRKELEPSYQPAVATLFAVIIAIRDI